MLKLAPVFSNHMVLQRDKRIAVWGQTDRKAVTISLNERTVCAEAEEGVFYAELPPFAAGGPYSLTVSDGTETVTYEDVMLGEVWLAGGQSNMELELQNSFDGDKELGRCAEEKIRYYYVPKHSFVSEELLEEEAASSWECASQETAGRWSAVAYYFAKEVSRKLGVTVGLLGCNWGGTSASCWLSREMQESSSVTSSYVEEYDAVVESQDFDEYVKEREEYIIYQTEFDRKVSQYYETCEHPTWDEAIRLFGENRYPGPMGPYSEHRPAGLYETMLSRICPYTLKGFLYYQGEEDDHKPETYYELLSALIRQWRTDWGDETLPFLLVQLPVFQNEGEPDFKNWPLIREAQMRVFQTVKNTGIAIILEQGEYGNIHPTRKAVVGQRLAMQAFSEIYQICGRKDSLGPVYRDFYVDGKEMVLCFDYCEGFECLENATGFELAGADKIYHPAVFEIRGEQIVLTAESVEKPVYARYGWSNYLEVGVFGRNGLPLAPFRTSRTDGSKVTGSRLSSEGVT